MNISTSSAASEDSPLLLDVPVSTRSPSANQMNVVAPSLKNDGDCPLNQTSESLTEESTQESLFSPGDPHANPLVAPGSKEARMMTAGSGAKLCACLKKQSPIAPFSRTLLESSMWGSTEYFLRWEGSATKRNASIFRLVPWTRRNCDIESGLSVCWVSPTRTDQSRGSQPPRPHDTGIPLNQQLAGAWPTPRSGDSELTGAHRGNAATLTSATRAAAWSTPNVPNGGRTLKREDVINRGATDKGKRQVVLENEIRHIWPTPMARDQKGQMFEKDGTTRMDYVPNVPNVLKASWPTPNASDGSGGGQDPKKRKAGNHSVQLPDYIGKTQFGCLARTESFVVRLTTLSTWLMGYSPRYLALWEAARTGRSSERSETP